MLFVSPGYQPLLITPSVSLTFMMLSLSPGYQLLWITPSVFSNVYDVVCVSGLSICLWCRLCLQVINYSWLLLMCSLTFMMLSVSSCYQLLLITTSVFSNVYDVVCVPCYQLLLIAPSVFSNVYDVVCIFVLSITFDYRFCVL